MPLRKLPPVRIESSDAHRGPHLRAETNARQFFAAGGTLSKWHPAYEFRQGQVAMAEAVESALADKRHLILEAHIAEMRNPPLDVSTLRSSAGKESDIGPPT